MTNLRFQLKAARTFFRPRYDFIFVSFRFLRCFCLSLQQHHQLLLLLQLPLFLLLLLLLSPSFSARKLPLLADETRHTVAHCPVSRVPFSSSQHSLHSAFCSILARLKSRVVPFPLNCVIMQKALCHHHLLHRCPASHASICD